MTPARAVEVWAHRQPDAPAIYFGSSLLFTYGQWFRAISGLARHFREACGVPRAAGVAIWAANDPDVLTTMHACWHAGLRVIPINPKLHPREVQYIVDQSRAACLVADFDRLAALRDCRIDSSTLRCLALGGSDFSRALECAPLERQEVLPDECAWLFYTSGTTGKPKGAILTYRSLLAMSLSYFIDYGVFGRNRRMLHCAPLSHGSGLYSLPFTLAGGSHIVPESRQYDAAETVAIINGLGAVTAFMAPTMLVRLMDSSTVSSLDLRRLDQLIYGGGPMHLPDLIRALGTFGPRLAQLYGQGESPMTISSLSKEDHFAHERPAADSILRSAGYSCTAVEVRIADANGHLVATGDVGEVLVRGDVVMMGYEGNDAATAEALRDGWLHTGDLGSLAENGLLTLKGRSKEVIISGGSNIYPREVEDVLLEHPDVGQAAVIGMPDRQWGEIVVACLTARAGCHVNPRDVERHCLDRIARFKRPKRFVVLVSMPVNPAGKIDRAAVLTMVQSAQDPASSQAD